MTTTKGHEFVPKKLDTLCDVCHEYIWGVSKQAIKCKGTSNLPKAKIFTSIVSLSLKSIVVKNDKTWQL
jgi:hypothetical protein